MDAVGGVGEVSVPPRMRQGTGEGVGGASNKLRTTMETMEVGEKVMDEKKAKEVDKTLVDYRNGFNELSRLQMLWTVCHHWPEGARFALNCYKHWAQLLLRQPHGAPVILLSREGVTQGDPLYIVLYGIPPIPWRKSSGMRILLFCLPCTLMMRRFMGW